MSYSVSNGTDGLGAVDPRAAARQEQARRAIARVATSGLGQTATHATPDVNPSPVRSDAKLPMVGWAIVVALTAGVFWFTVNPPKFITGNKRRRTRRNATAQWDKQLAGLYGTVKHVGTKSTVAGGDVFALENGYFLARGFHRSKTFKTRKLAEGWLARELSGRRRVKRNAEEEKFPWCLDCDVRRLWTDEARERGMCDRCYEKHLNDRSEHGSWGDATGLVENASTWWLTSRAWYVVGPDSDPGQWHIVDVAPGGNAPSSAMAGPIRSRSTALRTLESIRKERYTATGEYARMWKEIQPKRVANNSRRSHRKYAVIVGNSLLNTYDSKKDAERYLRNLKVGGGEIGVWNEWKQRYEPMHMAANTSKGYAVWVREHLDPRNGPPAKSYRAAWGSTRAEAEDIARKMIKARAINPHLVHVEMALE